MPKTQNKWSESIFQKRLKAGRGQGELASYVPWTLVQEIPSKGISSRILGYTTGRIHHLFSRNESAFFYLLDWNEDVIDIQEQYPLLHREKTNPIDTVDIALDAGIKHPRDPKSGYPYVCTSDFRIVTRNGVLVRSIKESKELEKWRVEEKLEIERRFWLMEGVDWKIVTENEINFQKASNIAWIWNRCRTLEEYLGDRELTEEAVSCFAMAFNSSVLPVSTIARDLEMVFHFDQGIGTCVYAQAVAEKRICADLSRRLDMTAVRIPPRRAFL